MLAYLTALVSTLFRIGIYLFLRVLPSSLLRRILPVLYVLYLSTSFLAPATPTKRIRKILVQNGDAKSEDSDLKDAQEELTESSPDPITTLLFSIPSPTRILNIANLAINTVLALAALEFVLYPAFDDANDVVFTRVGAVYPDAAKIVVRYPAANASENLVQVWYRQASGLEEATWEGGPTLNLTAGDDWVGTARIDGLWPSTNYEYDLASLDGNRLPYPAQPIPFHTFPDPRIPTGSHFRFVVSSCATPNFPYLPLHGRRIKGFDLLADYLWPSNVASPDNAADLSSAVEAPPPAEFMLFLGDFIYADVPMYFGDDREAYRRFYRRNYNSDSMRRVYERLPMFHTYDDHEFINNFVGQGNDSTIPFQNATDAFRLYNANANYDAPEKGEYYYDFRYGDTAFFVMDTRRYRSDITQVDVESRTMLGDKQLAALHEWLGRVNNTATFKFIVSSVPFTSLWTFEAKFDSWAPYTHEKASLLAAMHSVSNVIILSGDRHEFAAIRFNPAYDVGSTGHSIVEVSTSPMSMFYVPLVRTLNMESEQRVNQSYEFAWDVDDEERSEVFTDEYPKEQVLKYVFKGNYKWSTFEVDTREPTRPVARLELMADGVSAYKLEIAGKPVDLQQPSVGIEAFVPKGIKGVLSKIGLTPSRWF